MGTKYFDLEGVTEELECDIPKQSTGRTSKMAGSGTLQALEVAV